MREKYKSQLEKHGPGESHTKAQDRLVKVLMDCGFEVFPDTIFTCSFCLESNNGYTIMKTNMERTNVGYYHEFDIYCRKEHEFNLKTEKIFEIDGSSHEKKKQQNRDDTAEKYAEFFLPDCPVYRVPIEELIGPHKLSDAKLWILYKLR